MKDTRQKNVNWSVGDQGGLYSNVKDGAMLAVLMDIRDELQELNATFRCRRVAAMADAVIRAERRMAENMPLKPGRRRRG